MKKYLLYHNCCHVLWGFMAASFVFIALSWILLMPAFAQTDTVNVPSDIPPGEGNLNNAINAAIAAGSLSDTAFELESNGYYILTSTIVVPQGEHLTIVAPEPGATQETAPPQILWTSAGGVETNCNFNCYGGITLKNIWLFYANTNGEQIHSSLQIQDDPDANASGKGEIGIFDGVIFDYSSCPHNASGAVGVTAKHFNGTFKNCYFKNCIDSHFTYYGRAVSFPFDSPGWHIDNLRFEHCTFANIGYVYMQETGNYGDNIHFNHCTFLNVVMFSLESGWWYKMSVTNSIFLNTFMLENIPAQIGAGDPNGGTLRIDSVATFGFAVPFTEQDRRILFANNSYFIEPWLSDWMYNNPYSRDFKERGEPDLVPVPQPMLSPGTLRFFDTTDNEKKVFPFMNRASLYDSTDPGFIGAPTNMEALKKFLQYKWYT